MGWNRGSVGGAFSVWNLIAATAKFQVDALDLSIALQVGRAQSLWISYAEWFCITMIVLGLIWNMRMMPILLMGAVGIFMIQQIGLTPICKRAAIRSSQAYPPITAMFMCFLQF